MIRLAACLLPALLLATGAWADEAPKPHGQDDRPDHWAVEKPHDSTGPRGADNQPGAAMVRDGTAKAAPDEKASQGKPETGAAQMAQ